MKHKHLLIAICCVPMIILGGCISSNKIADPHTYETDDTRFYNGEILLPDYVHTDTLIVTDAKFLNWAMEYYDAASDGDIADILGQGTRKYCPPVRYSINCTNDTLFYGNK